eukprot:gb/GFBE01035237.1/.p1 GENE.gb/GFBE01035237.1/~~gb/GFBE01035237.1/.p1  ORF type:complete len:194 (+),score=34.89 gb/GFBE01035237.1/:1-582(+)
MLAMSAMAAPGTRFGAPLSAPPTRFEFIAPPPGLEMFGPGSSIGLKEAQEAYKDVDSDVCVSECSTADTQETPFSSPRAAGARVPQMSGRSSKAAEAPCLIQLEKVLPEAGCGGSAQCPSIGSAGHGLGFCKPCDFMHRGGCRSGYSCQFCHLCPAGENRRRKKEKRANRHVSTEMWNRTAGGAVPLSLQQLV